MARKKRVLLITGCTKTKALDDEHPVRAWSLYQGAGHVRVLKAVEEYGARLSLDWRILSAQHGLLPANDLIVPYEKVFPANKHDAFAAAQRLGVHRELRAMLSPRSSVIGELDAVIVALNERYLFACGLGRRQPEPCVQQPTTIFVTGYRRKAAGNPMLRYVTLTVETMRRLKANNVTLRWAAAAKSIQRLAEGKTTWP